MNLKKIILNIPIKLKLTLMTFFFFGNIVINLAASLYLIDTVKVGGNLSNKIDEYADILIEITSLKTDLLEMRKILFEMLLSENDDKKRLMGKKNDEISKRIDRQFEVLSKKLESGEDINNFVQLQSAKFTWEEFKRDRGKITYPAIFRGDIHTAAEIENGFQERRFYRFIEQTNSITNNINLAVIDSRKNVSEFIDISVMTLTGFNVISFILIFAANFFIARFIISVIKKLMKSVDNISKGSLDAKINYSWGDEIGIFAQEFNRFIDIIKNIITEIKDISKKLASSTVQISASVASFTDRLENQSEEYEMINTHSSIILSETQIITEYSKDQLDSIQFFLNELSSLSDIIKEMNEKIKNTLISTEHVVNSARIGEKYLDGMSDSMNKISTSSGEMTNIVSMINDISDKINLLSLNAAIESARAGHAGKGFAVISDEISKLADQTSSSINEVDNLIKLNFTETEKGIKTTKNTVKIITDIIDGINSISSMVMSLSDEMKMQMNVDTNVNNNVGNLKIKSSTIKEFSIKQVSTVHDINKNISTLNDITKQCVIDAKEISTTIIDVANVAEEMKNKVEFFRI